MAYMWYIGHKGWNCVLYFFLVVILIPHAVLSMTFITVGPTIATWSQARDWCTTLPKGQLLGKEDIKSIRASYLSQKFKYWLLDTSQDYCGSMFRRENTILPFWSFCNEQNVYICKYDEPDATSAIPQTTSSTLTSSTTTTMKTTRTTTTTTDTTVNTTMSTPNETSLTITTSLILASTALPNTSANISVGPDSPSARRGGDKSDQTDMLGVYIGAGVGSLVLISLILTVVLVCTRRSRFRSSKEQGGKPGLIGIAENAVYYLHDADEYYSSIEQAPNHTTPASDVQKRDSYFENTQTTSTEPEGVYSCAINMKEAGNDVVGGSRITLDGDYDVAHDDNVSGMKVRDNPVVQQENDGEYNTTSSVRRGVSRRYNYDHVGHNDDSVEYNTTGAPNGHPLLENTYSHMGVTDDDYDTTGVMKTITVPASDYSCLEDVVEHDHYTNDSETDDFKTEPLQTERCETSNHYSRPPPACSGRSKLKDESQAEYCNTPTCAVGDDNETYCNIGACFLNEPECTSKSY